MARTHSEVSLEVYNKIKEILKTSETPIKSLAISAIVYVAKKVFKENFFSCPVQNHVLYGSLFIYGPAMVLLLISLMVSESFWNLSISCFCCRRRNRSIWQRSRKSVYLCLLPSLVWLIFVFAEGNYYVCTELGPIEFAKSGLEDPVALKEVDIQFSNVHGQSQVIAWVLLLSLVAMATIILSVDRCFSRLGSRIIKKDEFDEIEAECAIKLINERIKPMAEAQAKTKVDQLFEANKDENPAAVAKLAEDYLMKYYPVQANFPWSSHN